MYSKVDTDLGMLKVTLDADGIARATRCGLLVHRSPTLDGMNRWLLAHGGRTINVPSTAKPQADKPTGPTTEQLVEMAMPGWDERGWHGGGEQPCRSKVRRTPKRGNTHAGRKAHRMPYGPGRTW